MIELGYALQGAGINYYGFRNEQAASYAAGAIGYMTNTPGYTFPKILGKFIEIVYKRVGFKCFWSRYDKLCFRPCECLDELLADDFNWRQFGFESERNGSFSGFFSSIIYRRFYIGNMKGMGSSGCCETLLQIGIPDH